MIMKSANSVPATTVNETLNAADELYLYALECNEALWDAGFYTKAIYIKQYAEAYKAACDRLKNFDLIS